MPVCLICANPDLNLIDGSSIWAQTLALALAETGLLDVHFLAKSSPEREELFAPLRSHPRITLFDGTDPSLWGGQRHRRLTPPLMVQAAHALNREQEYDLFIVRGFDIAMDLQHYRGMLERTWVYLTDIPQQQKDLTPEMQRNLLAIAMRARRVLCQSEGFRSLWREIAPNIPEERLQIYTPVVPDIPATLTPLETRPRVAVYAGKFRTAWRTLEMVRAWPTIRESLPEARCVMIGDKFHTEPDSADYPQEMKDALQNTPGVEWLGALSREAVQVRIEQAALGLSWRENDLDESIEYSTKILEYGRADCPAVLNRNAIHTELLGTDYPLFANNEVEFCAAVIRGLGDIDAAREAATRLNRVAQEHTFSRRVEWLHGLLAEDIVHTVATEAIRDAITGETTGSQGTPGEVIEVSPATKARICVLVTGHDLKFFKPLQERLEATGRFKFITDQWTGHNRHDEAQSLRQLQQADVIFCEWCLGNLRWYAQHKRPGQRLVARLHLQERHQPYLRETNLSAVDHITFVSEHLLREVLGMIDLPAERASVIPNFIDELQFPLAKRGADAAFTLGMVGITPRRKRLDLALDTLELLHEKNPRYCLRIKGAHPFDYAWMGDRPEEAKYYQAIFRRINSGPLRYSVIFDPQGNNVNTWMSLVGWILSPSDFESFHMAIGEGMLTGAKPVVWNWEGAAGLWPQESIVNSPREAAERIEQRAGAITPAEAEQQRDYIRQRYDTDMILRQWVELLIGHPQRGGSITDVCESQSVLL